MDTAEEELRYWLANEEWHMSQHTRHWLATTPAPVAADTLARIAQGADLDARSPGAALLTIAAVAGFSPSNGVAGGGPNARKAGVRAALMLAGLGDRRAIVPLVRTLTGRSLWRSPYAEPIEAALAQLLTPATPDAVREYAASLETLWDYLWNESRRRDLAPARARLLITLLALLPDAHLPTPAPAPVGQPERARVLAARDHNHR